MTSGLVVLGICRVVELPHLLVERDVRAGKDGDVVTVRLTERLD